MICLWCSAVLLFSLRAETLRPAPEDSGAWVFASRNGVSRGPVRAGPWAWPAKQTIADAQTGAAPLEQASYSARELEVPDTSVGAAAKANRTPASDHVDEYSEGVAVYDVAYNRTKNLIVLVPSEAGGPRIVHQLPSMHTVTIGDKPQSSALGTKLGLVDKLLLALGSGTGAVHGASGSDIAHRDMRSMMRYQDKAVLIMLFIVYSTTLGVGASLAYRQSCNDSLVEYYAHPGRHPDMSTEDTDFPGFVEAFAQVPKDVLLQVTGFVPIEDPDHESVDWNGQYYRVGFDFTLDLSPWVARLGNDNGGEVVDGMLIGDRGELQHFLHCNTNDLATVEVQKDVVWHGWEELATNLKNQIRQKGFSGVISVRRCDVSPLTVHKNRPWANFLHSRLTKVLCALSLLGCLVYMPYMWFRSTRLVVHIRYKIDLPIAQYWRIIVDQLCENGFQSEASVR